MQKSKHVRFYNMVMAFSEFQGKTLKSIDACEVLEDKDFDNIEQVLLKIASYYEDLDTSTVRTGMPELVSLAIAIRKNLR